MQLRTLFCEAMLAAFPALAEQPASERAEASTPRTYLIHRLPSELLLSPKAELEHVVDALDKDLESDLAKLDERSRSQRVLLLNARAQVAIHRGDFTSAQRFLREIRAQQDEEAEKLTSGVTLEKILETRIQAGSMDEQRARLKQLLSGTWGSMPWPVVGDYFKTAKFGLERVSRAFFIHTARQNLDPPAATSSLRVPGAAITMVLALRNQIEHVLPFRNEIVSVLKDLVEKNQDRVKEPQQRA